MKDEELKAEQARRHQIEVALGKLHEKPRQRSKDREKIPGSPPPDRPGRAYQRGAGGAPPRDPMNGNPIPRVAQKVKRSRQPRAQGQNTQDREAVRALGDFRGAERDTSEKAARPARPHRAVTF